MTEGAFSYLTAEAQARVPIDEMLDAAGWAVQDARGVNLAAALTEFSAIAASLRPPTNEKREAGTR
jgi:hypothetical protein